MSNAGPSDTSPTKLPIAATISGAIAAFITAGVVSWATPDGNLVVTLVPALVVGLVVFGLAKWRIRRRASK